MLVRVTRPNGTTYIGTFIKKDKGGFPVIKKNNGKTEHIRSGVCNQCQLVYPDKRLDPAGTPVKVVVGARL